MKKGAVLIETRLLPNLMEIIENHLLYLPEDWGFMIVGSSDNKEWFKKNFPDSPFMSIEKDLPSKDYNFMLTTKSFWESIPFDKVLIFQHDSRLLREGIEEFLDFDYVGGPWKFQNHGGNGGLSLRTKAAMIDIIEKHPPYASEWPNKGNEDVWFCNHLIKHTILDTGVTVWKLADREVCKKFSVESIYEEGTLGCHAIDVYLTPIECSTILNQYPALKRYEPIPEKNISEEIKRNAPSVEDKYKELCSITSDIFEHLPTLKHYASQSSHVTEFGFKDAVSTYALLAGRPLARMVTYDICYNEKIDVCYASAKKDSLDFNYSIADVLTISIEPTDLLFIDTLGTYTQLKRELDMHAVNVRKFIIIHDTEVYANSPEPMEWQTPEVLKNYVQNDKGMWPAIEEFLLRNTEWRLKEKFTNNNGLTIIERIR